MANPREMAAKLRVGFAEFAGPRARERFEEHNAQVAALLAAIDEEMRHADRLAEAAEAWIADMDLDAKGNPASVAAHLAAEMRRRFGDALSAHRARRGGQ